MLSPFDSHGSVEKVPEPRGIIGRFSGETKDARGKFTILSSPVPPFFLGLGILSEYLFGFTFIALGIYAGVQGTILEGVGWRRTLIYILGGILVSFIGLIFVLNKSGLL